MDEVGQESMTAPEITEPQAAQAAWRRSPAHIWATVVPIFVLLIVIGVPGYFLYESDLEAYVTRVKVDFAEDGKVIGQTRGQVRRRFGEASTNPDVPNKSWYVVGRTDGSGWYTLGVEFDPESGRAVDYELRWDG